MDKLITRTFLNQKSPAYLGGLQSVYRAAKKLSPNTVTREKIRRALVKQTTYNKHKAIRRKFPRNKTVAACIDSDWQIDLADMRGLAEYNDDFNHIFACVDVFSKYAFAIPIKNKQSTEINRAFKDILSHGRKPWSIFSDRGGEFTSVNFKKLLHDEDIIQKMALNTDTKAAVCERYIRTLKEMLWKHFTLTGKYRYLEILPKIVSKLNNRIHTATGMAPAAMTPKHQTAVYKKLYGDRYWLKPIHYRFKLNEKVRISKLKNPFTKGYRAKFTDEIFIVAARLRRNPPVYRVKDLNGKLIEGVFYDQELSSVSSDDDVFVIDKIIKTRTVKGRKQHYVKWRNYNTNTWINATDIL